MKNKAFVVLKRYFDTPKKERTGKIKNSFDHVLNYYNENDEEITGYKCLQFICDFMLEKNIDPSDYIFYFHTANPVGKKNMQSYWNNFQRHYKENNLKDCTKKL